MGKTITATEAANSFGSALMSAMRAPVTITRNGRPVAILRRLSSDDERMLARHYRELIDDSTVDETKRVRYRRLLHQLDSADPRGLAAGEF